MKDKNYFLESNGTIIITIETDKRPKRSPSTMASAPSGNGHCDRSMCPAYRQHHPSTPESPHASSSEPHHHPDAGENIKKSESVLPAPEPSAHPLEDPAEGGSELSKDPQPYLSGDLAQDKPASSPSSVHHGEVIVPPLESNSSSIGKVGKLPLLSARHHGAGCAMEIAILEKHETNCTYKKDEETGRSIDDRVGSYDCIGRMVFRTCALSSETSHQKGEAHEVLTEPRLGYQQRRHSAPDSETTENLATSRHLEHLHSVPGIGRPTQYGGVLRLPNAKIDDRFISSSSSPTSAPNDTRLYPPLSIPPGFLSRPPSPEFFARKARKPIDSHQALNYLLGDESFRKLVQDWANSKKAEGSSNTGKSFSTSPQDQANQVPSRVIPADSYRKKIVMSPSAEATVSMLSGFPFPPAPSEKKPSSLFAFFSRKFSGGKKGRPDHPEASKKKSHATNKSVKGTSGKSERRKSEAKKSKHQK